jgi:hypothetical protein
MTYSDLEAVLKTVLPNDVSQRKAPRGKTRYIVWVPVGSRSIFGSNRRGLTALQANVYVCTQTAGDTICDDVCAALDAAGIAYGDPVPDYDDETGEASWVIECEVP